jgi:hypothetical protein
MVMGGLPGPQLATAWPAIARWWVWCNGADGISNTVQWVMHQATRGCWRLTGASGQRGGIGV